MEQQQLSITSEIRDGRWFISLPHDLENIELCLELFKETVAKMKNITRRVKISADIEHIATFIAEAYIHSKNNVIKADELRRVYIKFINIDGKSLTPHKFGRLMTDYINSDANVFEIKRVLIHGGTGYRVQEI